MGEFDKDFQKFERDLVQLVTDYTVRVEDVAKEKYIPKGPTLTLSGEGTTAEPAEKIGNNIVGVITSSAKEGKPTKKGQRFYDYAEIQHDQPRRHVVNQQPIGNDSFVNYGEGTGPFVKYWDGYANRVATAGLRGWATKYLDHALEDIEPELDQALRTF